MLLQNKSGFTHSYAVEAEVFVIKAPQGISCVCKCGDVVGI